MATAAHQVIATETTCQMPSKFGSASILSARTPMKTVVGTQSEAVGCSATSVAVTRVNDCQAT